MPNSTDVTTPASAEVAYVGTPVLTETASVRHIHALAEGLRGERVAVRLEMLEAAGGRNQLIELVDDIGVGSGSMMTPCCLCAPGTSDARSICTVILKDGGKLIYELGAPARHTYFQNNPLNSLFAAGIPIAEKLDKTLCRPA